MHMQQDQKRSCFLASRSLSLLFILNPSFSSANYLYMDISVAVSFKFSFLRYEFIEFFFSR